MVDWIGFKIRLVNPVTGEVIDAKTFLARLYARFKRMKSFVWHVHGCKDHYKIRLTDTCVALAYVFEDSLVIGANPNHVNRGWNEYSVTTPDVAIAQLIRAIMTALRDLHGADLTYASSVICRLDVTQMLHCCNEDAGSHTHSQMRLHLRCVKEKDLDRIRSSSLRDNTIMIGEPKDGYLFRIYRSSSKPGSLLPRKEDRDIRVELVLHPKEIERLTKSGRWTPNDLNGMFENYVHNLREVYHQYRPARTKHPPRGLLRELVPAWATWILGIDLATIPAYAENYAKLCKQFLDNGIDITEAPSPRVDYSTSALSLTELLDPSRYNADGHQCPGVVDLLAVLDHKLHPRRTGKPEHG